MITKRNTHTCVGPSVPFKLYGHDLCTQNSTASDDELRSTASSRRIMTRRAEGPDVGGVLCKEIAPYTYYSLYIITEVFLLL